MKENGVIIIAEPAQTEWGFNAIVEDHDGRKNELTEVTPANLPQ